MPYMSYNDWLQKNPKPTWRDARLKIASKEGFLLVQRDRYAKLSSKYDLFVKHGIVLPVVALSEFLDCQFAEAEALIKGTLRPTDFPCSSVEDILDAMIEEWVQARDKWLADVYLQGFLTITTKGALEGWTKLLNGFSHGDSDHQRWKAAQYAGRWIDALLNPEPDEPDESEDDDSDD